ncbi:Ig-like domain-containing protein, partial [Euzebya tangerina]
MPLTSAPTHHRATLSSTTLRVLVGVLAAAMALTGMASPAAAQTGPPPASGDRSFGPAFSINTPGDITQTGNVVVSCTPGQGNCDAARAGTQSGSNNSLAMINVDIDSDPNTFNSSTADLTIPAGGEVLYAGLYWGARISGNTPAASGPDGPAAPTPADQGRVLLTVPGDADYQPIVADTVDGSATGDYQGVADVTAQVRAAGSGTYGVANVQAGLGGGRYGGWALIVAYRDQAEPARNLTIFDGYDVVSNGNPINIALEGFQTPPLGTVRSEVGILSWEGDSGITGDQLSLDGDVISDTNNPSTNFFNSSISFLGARFDDKNPDFVDQLAVDLDRVDASGILTNNQTSSTINLTSSGDQYFPGVVTFSTELFAPNVQITKTGRDINGGSAEPGDVIEYTIEISNLQPPAADGIDDAVDTVLTDELPAFTRLVPGSISYVDGVNAGGKTAAAGDDQVDVAGNVLTARLGTGADATDGGVFETDEVNTIRYRVEVLEGVVDGSSIDNDATVAFSSTADLDFENSSNVDSQPVVVRSDLSVRKSVDPAGPVAVGETVTYVLEVRNAGPNADPAVVLTDDIPAGISVTSLPAECTQVGTLVECDLGALASGTAISLEIEGEVTGAPGDSPSNTATVSGDNTDPDPGNNTSAAVAVDIAQPPVADDDTASTGPGTPVTIDVLSNDSDPDGDDAALTITAVSDPPNGSVTIVDGQLVYTPDPGFAGQDTFTYTVTDEQGLTQTATVTVDVANADPVARNDAGAVEEGQTITIDLLANDTDVNGDDLSVSFPGGLPDGVTDNGDGTITYDPGLLGDDDPDVVVVPPFTYEVDDGNGGTATATVSLTVTQVPPVTAPDSGVTDPETPITIDVLANDAAPGSTGPLGVVGVDVDPAVGEAIVIDGQVQFTPAPGVSGDVEFTYTVRDASGSTLSETVTVTVNNAPPEATDDTAAVPFDTPTTIDVLANDNDPNDDPLTVIGVDNPVGGTVTIDAGSGLPVFTPDPTFVGEGSFEYTISDGNGGTDTATVTVDVANAPPVANDDAAVTDTDTPVTVYPLDNDTDSNSDTLTVSIVGGVPEGGSAVVNPDGSVVVTPPPGFTGTYEVTYEVRDGNGGTDTATISVTVANALPDARDDFGTVAAYGPAEPPTTVTIDALANDTDSNSDTLTVTQVDTTTDSGGTIVDNGDGTFDYTPAEGFTGTDSFTYTIEDGRGGTATATVVIEVSADAPLATDDLFVLPDPAPGSLPAPLTAGDLLGNDTSPNGLDLTVTGVGTPSSGTVDLNPDGTIDYTPDPTFVGTAEFTYTIADTTGTDTGTDTAVVRIVVPNAIPTAGDDTADVPGTGTSILDVLGNDSDPNGSPLTVTGTQGGQGTVTVNPDGTLSYTPPPGFKGTDTITYTVTDPDGGTATATVTVTVANEPPVAVDDDAETDPATPVDIPVLDNDSDPNDDPISVSTVGTPANGSAVAGGDGTITYTPTAGFKGTDTFEYSIIDGDGGTDTATVTVVVPNAPPEAGDDTATTDENTPVTIDVAANDSDPNGDPLTFGLGTQPSNGTVTIDTATGTVVYTPFDGFDGTDTFTYVVDDGDGGITTATVTVTVGDVPPTASDDAASVDGYSPGEDPTSVTIDALANDLDPAGNGLEITGFDDSGIEGTVEIVDGELVYTPPPGFVGTETFPYTITDGSGNTATADVTVTVGGLEPQAEDDSATVDGYGGDGDPTSVTIDVLGNDADPAGGGLDITDVDTSDTQGTVDIVDGQLVYTPPPGFVGLDTFTYEITDINGNTSTATVSVEVNDLAPVAEDDDATVTTGGSVRIPVLDNDFDPNGGPITINPDGFDGPANGTVEIGPDGQLIYTPNEGFVGTDTFVYEITDEGGNTTTATVTVTVLEGDGEPGAEVVRVAGDTRIETAILVAQIAYPDGAPWVVLARSDDYADALSGATIARQLNAPILLTSTGQLDSATSTEITRLGAENALILGGEVAVSAETAGQVADLGLDVSRVGGVNRFDTARLVQANLDEPDGTTVYITEGENVDPQRGWPDALGVSSQAAFSQRPILLVNATRLPQETIDALAASEATNVIVVGGTAAVSAEVEQQIADLGFDIERIAGATRYETLALLYQEGLALGLDPEVLWVATGLDWPDALTTGPVIGALGDTV